MVENMSCQHLDLLQRKEWFIMIDHQEKGPYSVLDLKNEPDFNPDTLVWKRGLDGWVAARFVPELNNVFKDDVDPSLLKQPDNSQGFESDFLQNQEVLTLQQDPYQLILWLLVLILIGFYLFYRFYYHI